MLIVKRLLLGETLSIVVVSRSIDVRLSVAISGFEEDDRFFRAGFEMIPAFDGSL